MYLSLAWDGVLERFNLATWSTIYETILHSHHIQEAVIISPPTLLNTRVAKVKIEHSIDSAGKRTCL